MQETISYLMDRTIIAVAGIGIVWLHPALHTGIIAVVIVMLYATSVMKAVASFRMLRTLPNPLDKPINADHGDNLREVTNSLRFEELEYGAIFTRDGRKIKEQTLLSPETISVDTPNQEASGNIFVHNHPGLYESSFSPKDFATVINNNIYMSMVVTRQRLYVLTNELCYPDDEECCKKALWALHYVGNMLDGPYKLFSMVPGGSYFCRWYAAYVSCRVAKKFGLKFQIKYFWIEKLKSLMLNYSQEKLPQ